MQVLGPVYEKPNKDGEKKEMHFFVNKPSEMKKSKLNKKFENDKKKKKIIFF